MNPIHTFPHYFHNTHSNIIFPSTTRTSEQSVPFRFANQNVRISQLSHACYDERGSRVRFTAGAWNFSLHHSVQNGCGAHPAYLMGTRGFSLGVKRPGREADHSPPSSAEVKEWVKLYLHSPNTPPLRGAQLSTGTLPFTFTLPMHATRPAYPNH
jgi:hypothetical protein